MARPSKLTETQCETIRYFYKSDIKAPELAKLFEISESSVYKILNGSYVAAPTQERTVLPPGKGQETGGFSKTNGGSQVTPEDCLAAVRVLRAAEANVGEPVDEITLAAAELILAQARYERALNPKS